MNPSETLSVEVQYKQKSCFPEIESRVNNCLTKVFSPMENPPMYEVTKGKSKEEKRINTIYHSIECLSPRFTNGDPLPNNFHRERNIETIRRAVSENSQIPAVVVIGTLLDPSATFPEREEGGLLGALMVQRLLEINQQVSRVHEPGLQIFIHADNFVSHYLFDHSSTSVLVEKSQTKYLESIDNQISVLQKVYKSNPIKLITESEIYHSLGLSNKDYFDQCDTNFVAFSQYLAESEKIIAEEDYEENITKMSSYKNLQNLGWQGFIPIEMRDFFRSRIKGSHQNITDEEIDKQLARWFATTLTKAQKKTVDLAVNNKPHIRLSFVKTAPGVSKEFQRAIGLNAHPRTDTYSDERKILPWRGRAYIQSSQLLSDKTRLKILPTYVDFSKDSLETREIVSSSLLINNKHISDFWVSVI